MNASSYPDAQRKQGESAGDLRHHYPRLESIADEPAKEPMLFPAAAGIEVTETKDTGAIERAYIHEVRELRI